MEEKYNHNLEESKYQKKNDLSDSFEPIFSKGLKKWSKKLTKRVQSGTKSYIKETQIFGGQSR